MIFDILVFYFSIMNEFLLIKFKFKILTKSVMHQLYNILLYRCM